MMYICKICGETCEGTSPTLEENWREDKTDPDGGHYHYWVSEEEYNGTFVLTLDEMSEPSPQQRVMAAVYRRGYRDGWSAENFLVRQVAKLAEELGEVAEQIERGMSPGLAFAIRQAAGSGKFHFDSGYWTCPPLDDDQLEALAGELADMQVVLFCAAATVSEILGEEIDLVGMAVAKAETDIKRGAR